MPDVALLSFTGGARNFIVRTNPNYISYSYNLRTQSWPTYGGKIVQILGVNYGTVQIEIESGSPKTINDQPGGYAYFRSVIEWFKDTSIWQRNNKQPIRMTYPARNYVLDVFLKTLTIADDLKNVLRPLQIEMEIEDDFTGLLTGDILDSELQYFQDGIGYESNPYNTPPTENTVTLSQGSAATTSQGSATGNTAGGGGTSRPQ